MTTPFWCLLIISLIPYVLAAMGGYQRLQQLGGVDFSYPRTQALELEGIAARTYAAQLNAWEALAVFTAAVMVAHLAGADADKSATASIVFVVARIIQAVMYVGNQPPLRTGSFLVAWGSALYLFYLAASAG